MSTLSLRKKLQRSRPGASKGQRTMRKIRKYAPWVAAICVGAYLPPKVLSSNWKVDADGAWNSPGATGNWDDGNVPNTSNPVAEFVRNFTANRTISLVSPLISPTVGLVRFDDTSPSSTLTILGSASTKLQIKAITGNLATFDVSKGNTLQLSSALSTDFVLGNPGGDSSGLNKIGNGLLSINGLASYTGPTKLTQGILVATTLGKGGVFNSSIGQSSRAASNLVFDGGVLRYASAATTATVTDRSFTIEAGGATIDSSSANSGAALIFGTTFTGTGVTPALQTPDGPGTTIVSANGDRSLTLRGTNTGANEIQATITDFGNSGGTPGGFHTSLTKLDTGFWKLSGLLLPATSTGNEGVAYTATYNSSNPATWLGNLNYGNTYTGATTIQRGTLQIVFPLLPNVIAPATGTFAYSTGALDANRHLGMINPKSELRMGSAPLSGLPGGGTFELASGVVQRITYADQAAPSTVFISYSGAIQDFNQITINSGANTFNRVGGPSGSTNNAYIYLPTNNIVHNTGGTLRLTADNLLKLSNQLPVYANGTINGWIHRDDNWAAYVAVDTLTNQTNLSLNYKTPYTLNSFTSYVGASDSQGPSVLGASSNVVQNTLFTSVFSNGSSSSTGNQRFINSIKFEGTLAANFPNKQFQIGTGDDPSALDFGLPATTMALANGGFLVASNNGITQMVGGRITSGSGDFQLDLSDPMNPDPPKINMGGGTVGQSEIFAIIRSSPAAPFYLASSIVDYYSRIDTSMTLSVGLTKSGTGTLILLDATSTGQQGAAKNNYQGDTYINEGILAIRSDSALGATFDHTDFYIDPDTGNEIPPNYKANGTHGQTYLLGNTSVLDFQAVKYTLPELINVFQGEIQATIGRSTFAGRINNLNEEEKAIIRVGTYLELNGDIDATNGQALIGVGGYRKLGNGLLIVNGDTKVGTSVINGQDVPSASEFPGSGDITLEAGSSVWNGKIDLVNGSIIASAPAIVNSLGISVPQYASFNGPITIVNGHLTNQNSLVAFTKAGQLFTVELQQSGSSAQTLFGNLNQVPADGVQVYTGAITVGQVGAPGGSLAILGSIDFGAAGAPNPVNLTLGTLSQVAVVNGGYIPTTRFFGPVTLGQAGTVTLNHNTLFNDTLTLGQAGAAVTLVTNGIGHTTFNDVINVVNGNLTLTDTSFTKPFTQAQGTMTLNGFDTFNKSSTVGGFTMTGGTFAETGTRRTAGVYGVRDTFIGNPTTSVSFPIVLSAITIAPPTTLASTLALTFSGNNDVQGDITITGAAPLLGITLQRADVTFANAQNFSRNLIVNGGQVTVASSNALGTGSTLPGDPTGIGGVILQGEKPVLNFQRGVQTSANEDIVVNASTSTYLSGIAVTNYGSGYAAAPAITVTGGSASLQATATSTLSGGSLLSVNMSGVGTGYNPVAGLPSLGQSGNATLAPVFGGAVIRGVDQHNVIDGSIIFNNTTGGKLNAGVPLLSVGQDDTLQIKGDIFGIANVTSTTPVYASGQLSGRFMTTALLGSTMNSSSGIIILSGQVKDSPSGASSGNNILNTEWVGSNDLNVQVEKQWASNGLIQLAQGVMRYTNANAAQPNFFASGVDSTRPNLFALSVPNNDFGHTSVGFNSVAGNGIQTAAFFLTQPGQVFNNNAFSVYLGNSNKLIKDGQSTGFVVIGGENTSGTVTYGTHLGNITLDVDTAASPGALRDLRLFANAGGTVDIQHNFVKSGTTGQISIDKAGDGTVWLSGSATGSALDRVFVLGGTLELRNFGAYNTQRLSATNGTAQLFLGGGTLRLFTGTAVGSTGATAAVSQSIPSNIFVRSGLSSLQVQSGGFSSTLALGSPGTVVTRSIGGAARFALVNGGGAAQITLSGTNGLGNRVTGPVTPLWWSSYGTSTDPTSNQAATHFAYSELANASSNPNVIMPYTLAAAGGVGGTLTVNDNLSSFATSNQNIEESGTGGFVNQLTSGYTTLNLVRFHDNATGLGGNLDLRNQHITLSSSLGGGAIMVASNVTGNNRIISNGFLTSSGSNDIVLQNWGGDGTSVPKLTVSAVIENNGLSDNPLTIVGDGTTVLTGANTFRGNVYLSGGTLEVASQAPLGGVSTNIALIKTIMLDGGTLHTTGDFTWDAKNIVAYGERSTIQIDAGKTFTLVGNALAGGINSQSPEVINSNTVAYGGTSSVGSGTANIFSGELVFSGGGTFLQVRDNVPNQIAGQMFVNADTRLVFEGNNANAATSSPGSNWMGNNLSWMDGTTIASGGTIELRPTVNSSGNSTVGEWLHINGAGQAGAGGALVMKRPEAVINGVFVNAAAALTDHTLSWTGPVTMDGPTTIFVDDKPEVAVAGLVGQLTFDDTIFDGGTTNTLTKAGDGILRFNNSRIQNLGTISITKGEVRFEGGILGTVGSAANKTVNNVVFHTGSALAPADSFNNFFSGTNSIVVGNGATSAFASGARLAFVDVRGTHNADITLNNGFLFVQSADAPLQATSFASDFNLIGSSAANAIEAVYANRVNPIVMFGAFTGTGGFTKFGNNEIDFVNPNSTFSGEILISRGGGSITSPGVGLYDTGKFTNVSSVRLTGDGSLFLDNQNSLNGTTGDDNQSNRINDNAAIHMSGASRFRMLGNNSADSSEAVGVLNVHRGSSSVTMDPAYSLKNVSLSFDNYTRDAGGVVNFRVLKTGVDFGNGTDPIGNTLTSASATVTLRHDIAPALFKGGAGLDRLGGIDPQSTSIVIGAFGGTAARNYATLPANTSLPLALNNNDQPFTSRGLMTVETVDNGSSVTRYLRPLKDSEYLNATRTGIRVTDTYDFDSYFTKGHEDPFNPGEFPETANGTNKNVRLIGKFGPSTSALAESNFATQKFYLFDQRDDSRRQDSLYRVLDNITFNSLTFAQQTTEVVDGAGNRIMLEISGDKTLTIKSGMILHAGLGVIGAAAPSVAFNSTQAALIRGGKLSFGNVEGIIQNVAAGLNETTGVFSSFRQIGSSPIANLNIGASDLTISSSIDGTGGVTKSGPSTVNFSGKNTYSGTTNVTEGILRLENNDALGLSNLVVVSGTGELRMQRGIVVGSPTAPHALKLRFASVAQTSAFRAEAGNNTFNGDIEISTLNTAGDRFVTTANPYDVSLINGTGASFVIGGDIYALDSASGGITPLNDVQRGRQARIVNLNNASTTGGVIEVRGSFRDLQTGAVPTFVQSNNEEQVLRVAITGASNSNVNVYSTWDAAGSILLRQGALHFMPGQTDFFTKNASNAINPFNAQAHPTIGDQSGLSGDVLLGLTTNGQVFNSPTLQVINNGTSNVTLAGENTSGTVKFFAPSAASPASTQFNDASLRISSWDRNVRLWAAPGGTMEIAGKITDPLTTNNGSITKVGSGTVILRGMDGTTAGYVNGTSNFNDFDKGINVAAGTLILDSQVASNTAVANIWGVTTTQLTLAGGKLQILGRTDNGARALDTWNNTITIRNGASEVALVPNSGGVTLTVGQSGVAPNRGTGGTVNFATPGSTGIISYLPASGSGGMIGPWATYGSAPGVATDFAATTADATKSVIGVGGYTVQSDASQFNLNNLAKESTTGFIFDQNKALANSVKLIRFDAPNVASTLFIRPQGVTIGSGIFDEGGILVPTGTNALKTISAVTAAGVTGSELQVFGGKELFVFNYGGGGLNITAPIIGASSIVLSGPGTTTLGRNRQTGNMYLNEGVTSVDKLNFEPMTIAVAPAAAGQTVFTLPNGVSINDIRTGSSVVGFNGATVGTVTQVDSQNNRITISAAAALGANSLTITPATQVSINFNLASATNGTIGTITAGQSGVAVGAAVIGTGVPVGTYVTGVSGVNNTQVSFSQSLTNAQNITLAVPNGLGLATSGSTGFNINGGTLQYTGNTVQTDRNVAIADGGATFNITQATTSMQIGTIVTTSSVGGPSGNPNGGGLIKAGPGTLVVSGASGANTYTGLTDVQNGMLAFQSNSVSGITAGPLGSSTNALDGTVVRNGGTLRMQLAGDLTTQEWLTFEQGSGFDVAPQNANRTLNLDGVINVQGTTAFSYTGASGGTAVVNLNPNAGYLIGPGVISKGTVNNGAASVGGNAPVVGGVLVLNESNPQFSGGFNVEGGRLIIRSVGLPTGTGAAGQPINLGTSLVNDLTSSTSKGSPDARIIFQMRDLVNANGGTTATGAFDSFQIDVGIPQDIIVNRPADALPGIPSSQIKQIGVIGTGLSLDQYNLNGNLRLRDDLQFYVEDTFTNINALEEYVNFNINGHIITDAPINPGTGLPDYIPTFTSKLNISGRPAGALPGIYNNLYVVVSLNNSNPGFVGNLTFGNTQGTDEFGFPISNPDANHVLRLNNDLALNSSNKITLLNDVTLQVPGHNVTIGSLIDNNISGTQTRFSGGLTTGYIVSGAQAIVENGSGTASILTINQTEDSDWRFLIRDGYTVDGARTASLGLVKTGPAIVRIINANDFSGGLTVLDGTVLVRNSGSTGSATGLGKVDVIGAAFGGDNTSPIAGDLTIKNSATRPGVLTPGRITPEGITLGDTLNVSNLIFETQFENGRDRVEFDTYSDEGSGNNDRVNAKAIDINGPVELVLRLHAGEGNDTFGHVFTPGDPIDLDGEYFRLFTSSNFHIEFHNNAFFYYNNQFAMDGDVIHGFYLDENEDPTSRGWVMQVQITDSDVRLIAVPEPNIGLTLLAGVGALVGLQRFRRRGRAA